MSGFEILERMRRSPERAPSPVAEVCELCGEVLADRHGHVVNVEDRAILCTCRSCYLLFVQRGAAGGRFLAVPDRYVALPPDAITAVQWSALQIPVSVVFIFVSSPAGRAVGFYPGPAGATESTLDLSLWEEIVAATPVLATLEPDVEALLIRADASTARVEAFIVPVDACYELVGVMRACWRGFDGGEEARRAVLAFFDTVSERAGG